MKAADALSLLAIAVSVLSLVMSLRREERYENLAFVRVLQGDMAAVAYVASVIRNTGQVAKGVDAGEIAAALCIAWVFEGRHRTRAVVLGAIVKLAESQPQLIRRAVDQIDGDFDLYLDTYQAADGDIIRDGILQRGRNCVEALQRVVRGDIPRKLGTA